MKVKSNGTVLAVEDTPAIVYEGRTLVPIYMLKNLGASVNWNEDDYSVNVSINGSGNVDLNKLKLISRISHHYFRLIALCEILLSVNESYSLAFDAIQHNYKPTDSLKNSLDRLNKSIDSYNSFLKPTSDLIAEAKNSGIDVSELNVYINSLNQSIDYLKDSYNGINSYYSSQNDTNFNKYLENRKKSDSLIDDVRSKASDGYYKYYSNIQNF